MQKIKIIKYGSEPSFWFYYIVPFVTLQNKDKERGHPSIKIKKPY